MLHCLQLQNYSAQPKNGLEDAALIHIISSAAAHIPGRSAFLGFVEDCSSVLSLREDMELHLLSACACQLAQPEELT